MAFDFQKPYGPAIEQQLRQYYQSLSEKDRRRFAAIQAITPGHGGIRYIAQVLGCDPQTIHEGMRELKQLPEDPAGHRVRKRGGGRKKTEVKHAALIQQVHDTIKDRTAGDPMREDVVWTDVTPQEIADSLHAHAVSVGPRIVRRILDTLGFARRQMAKAGRMNEIFEGSTQRGLPSHMNTTATPIIESSSPATGASADYSVVIRPSKGFSKLDFVALWEFRELFYFLGWRDVRILYKQTVIGAA